MPTDGHVSLYQPDRAAGSNNSTACSVWGLQGVVFSPWNNPSCCKRQLTLFSESHSNSV